jgi:hypothetical protein
VKRKRKENGRTWLSVQSLNVMFQLEHVMILLLYLSYGFCWTCNIIFVRDLIILLDNGVVVYYISCYIFLLPAHNSLLKTGKMLPRFNIKFHQNSAVNSFNKSK